MQETRLILWHWAECENVYIQLSYLLLFIFYYHVGDKEIIK